jgi:hypothetical protein
MSQPVSPELGDPPAATFLVKPNLVVVQHQLLPTTSLEVPPVAYRLHSDFFQEVVKGMPFDLGDSGDD